MKDYLLLGLMLVTIIVLFCVAGTTAGILTWAFVRHYHPSISFLSSLKLGFVEITVYLIARTWLKN